MELTGDYVAQMLADSSGQTIESVSFADPDGSNVKVVTTKAHQPTSARGHRKAAQALMRGKSGMSDAEKVAQMEAAVEHLNAAIALMKQA
jgi:hypothetical protein